MRGGECFLIETVRSTLDLLLSSFLHLPLQIYFCELFKNILSPSFFLEDWLEGLCFSTLKVVSLHPMCCCLTLSKKERQGVLCHACLHEINQSSSLPKSSEERKWRGERHKEQCHEKRDDANQQREECSIKNSLFPFRAKRVWQRHHKGFFWLSHRIKLNPNLKMMFSSRKTKSRKSRKVWYSLPHLPKRNFDDLLP